MRSGSAAVAEENVTIVEIEMTCLSTCPEGFFNGLFFYTFNGQ